jgi:hypothetical protein
MVYKQYDKSTFDSLKSLFSLRCQLDMDAIDRLEKMCFDYAITTIRPNNEVTYLLLEKSYLLIASDKATYKQIVDDFKYWMMMPL